VWGGGGAGGEGVEGVVGGGGGGGKAEKAGASHDETLAKYDHFLVHSGFGHVVTTDGGETHVRGTVTQRRGGVFWCDSEMAFVELRKESEMTCEGEEEQEEAGREDGVLQCVLQYVAVCCGVL